MRQIKLMVLIVLGVIFFVNTELHALANWPGSWTQGSYSNSAGNRSYSLYVPHDFDGKKEIPLMVMLHGCFQTVQEFAEQTGMNLVAEKYGFAVLYPEQTYQNNVWKCWNWFKPENQSHEGGEPSIVIGMIEKIDQTMKLDHNRIFVAGLSAGAAMASNMVACHSDLFAGAGIHSGLEYRAATNEKDAHQATANGATQDINQSGIDAAHCAGSGAKTVAVVVVHGNKDPYVNPINSERIVAQFSKMNDILDDSRDNNSQTSISQATRNDKVPNGYAYQTDLYGSPSDLHIEKIIVNGMGHAWSGSPVQAQYADPKGPNVAEIMWLFFSEHARP